MYSDRGAAKLKLDDYKGAIEDCDKAIKISPYSDAKPYCNRGIAKAHIGDFKGAISDWDYAVVIDPKLKSYVDELKAKMGK